MAVPMTPNRYAQDVSRKHVAGTLDTPEVETQASGQHLGQGGFADPGNILDQQVPAGKQTGQGQGDLFLLPQNDLADIFNNILEF